MSGGDKMDLPLLRRKGGKCVVAECTNGFSEEKTPF